MKPIIEVTGLSKKYKIGELQPYFTLRDSIAGWARIGRKLAKDEFWALRNVTFKVSPGETLGIIGPNGAGKSTLLKILSRITPPTRGEATLRGRIGSLLEVGTGFHQELTGRENIYLNGAILGMTRREINKKLDEIVDFSGVEKFLDMPVKHYSSGMYTRLAFSVAVNLESEILIVDEVLAVGDAEFQRKCLDKISEITREEGKTALFVSHNMNSVERLCNQCILLTAGRVKKYGSTSEVIKTYLGNQMESQSVTKRVDRRGNGGIRVSKVIFRDSSGRVSNDLVSGKDCSIEIHYRVMNPNIKNFNLSIGIDSLSTASRIAFIGNKIVSKKLVPRKNKPVKINIKDLPFLSGQYAMTIFVDSRGEVLDWIENAGSFSVTASGSISDRAARPVGQGDILLNYDVN